MLCFSAHNQAQYQWHSWLCVDSQDWERVHIYSEICGVLAPTECPATWRWDTPSLPGVVSRSGPTLSQCRRDGGEEGKVWLDREIGLVVPFLPFMPLPLPPPPTQTHTLQFLVSHGDMSPCFQLHLFFSHSGYLKWWEKNGFIHCIFNNKYASGWDLE